MTQKRMTCHGELPDGTTWEQLPVPVATRIQWEKTARVQKWSHETHPLTLSAFVSWHASKRAGIHDLTWEEFSDVALVADIDQGGNDETTTEAGEGEDDEDRPTTPSESTTTA